MFLQTATFLLLFFISNIYGKQYAIKNIAVYQNVPSPTSCLVSIIESYNFEFDDGPYTQVAIPFLANRFVGNKFVANLLHQLQVRASAPVRLLSSQVMPLNNQDPVHAALVIKFEAFSGPSATFNISYGSYYLLSDVEQVRNNWRTKPHNTLIWSTFWPVSVPVQVVTQLSFNATGLRLTNQTAATGFRAITSSAYKTVPNQDFVVQTLFDKQIEPCYMRQGDMVINLAINLGTFCCAIALTVVAYCLMTVYSARSSKTKLKI